MEEQLFKNKDRIVELGEVFTPKETVIQMLNLPGVKEQTELLTSTFLEPSAGEGAFLTELLQRKMRVAFKKSSTLEEYEDNILVGLSTLYGIELMEDNVEMLVMQMNTIFQQNYQEGIKSFNGTVNDKVIKSAMVIIQANMAQGNALTKLDSSGKHLMFIEWKLLPKQEGSRQQVQRTEFKFEDIIAGETEPSDISPVGGFEVVEEISLFDFLDDEEDQKELAIQLEEEVKKVYLPVPIVDVYQKILRVEGH